MEKLLQAGEEGGDDPLGTVVEQPNEVRGAREAAVLDRDRLQRAVDWRHGPTGERAVGEVAQRRIERGEQQAFTPDNRAAEPSRFEVAGDHELANAARGHQM